MIGIVRKMREFCPQFVRKIYVFNVFNMNDLYKF